MFEAHDNIQVNESGLILNPAHPHLGLVVCDCCGEGCIEVKCPYCIRDCKLDETVVIKTCLKESDGTFQLKVHINIIIKYKPSYSFLTMIMLILCYGQ